MSIITNRVKLNEKNIGVVFGTFAPLHSGHQQEIYKAAALNDAVIIVVSGYKGDRGDEIGLDLNKRFRYLREAFADEEKFRITYINEDNIPRYPDGWKPWSTELLRVVNEKLTTENDHNITVYVGEKEYTTKLNELMPKNWNSVLSERQDIPVSGTAIRNDPVKYWNYINRVFRRHFTKKVLVVGSASTGKSTLIRRLARSINAPFSEEYARTYEEESNITDEELTVNDYSHFIQGQFDANYAELTSPSNQGIVFFDTDAIVTKVYAKMYLPESDNKKLAALFDDTISREDFDLIFVIPPITKYVDDNFRAMEWADSRYDFHNNLMKELEFYGFNDKIVILDDQGENDGFYARYKHALTEISKINRLETPKLN